MSDFVKRKLILWCVMPLVLLIYLYPELVHYYWLNKYDFDSAPQLLALIKYCVSLVFDWADINLFSFAWPVEFAEYLDSLYPEYNGAVRARAYHIVFEVLGESGRPYIYFPAYVASVFVLGFGIAMTKILNAPAEEKAKNQKFLRGVQRVSASDFCKISKAKIKDPIAVLPTTEGNILLSDKMLRQHSLILGSTGTGKSQLLISLINSFLKNSKARLVFVDRKGEFYSLFGSAKDTLIHPFDARGTRWNIFNEIEVQLENGQLLRPPQDAKAIAELLFQPQRHKGNDSYWYEGSTKIFVSAICHCIIAGKTTNRDLCRFLSGDQQALLDALKALPVDCQEGASILGNDPKSKTFGNMLSVCNNTALQLSHFADDGDFSVREWLHNGSGNLYISTAGRNDNTFTGIVTLLIDLIGREVKELPDDGNQPTSLVFVLDELGALPAMDTLKFLLTQARSKGVAVVLANQTFSKIKAVYGDAEARDLLANTKSRYFFALPAAGDAKYISELLGSAEVERIVQSENSSHSTIFGKIDGREGKNYSRQIAQDATFLPGTIESLEVGQAIVQQAALPGIVSMVRFKQMPEQKKINAEYKPLKHELQAATAYAAAQKLEAETSAVPEPAGEPAPDPEPPTEQTAGNEADLFL